MSERDAVSQRWLLGILVSVLIMGGAGWMTYVQAQISDVKKEQQVAAGLAALAAQVAVQVRGQADADILVIREKIKRLEEDTREIKGDVKEQTKKLDELLRRAR